MSTDESEIIHSSLPELKNQLSRKEIGRRDFIRTATLLGLSAGAAYGFAGILAPEQLQAATPKKGGMLKLGMVMQEMNDPANFNWIEPSNIARHICDYLVEVDENNISRPALAEKWRASDDLKTWTFDLRKGVKFNNGDDFTADDVIYNVKRWTDKDSKSVNKTILKDLKEVEKVNDHQVIFHLNEAKLDLVENLFQYSMVIVHRDFDKNGADLSKFPVGTGAFTLESYEVGNKAVLKKRKGYWNGDANLDQITVIDLGTEYQAYLNALAAKQIDLAYAIENDHVSVAKKLKHVQVFKANTSQTLCIRMKVNKKPFDDIRVRQAITLCADNKKLLAVAVRGQGVLAENHHVAPIHPEYAKLPALKQNVAQAKKLLAEAGYKNGLDVECFVGNTQGRFEQQTLEVLREMLLKANIRMKINVLPTAQFWPIWDKADFSTTFWAHRPLGTMVLGLAYITGAIWNETEFSNAEFDAAYKRAVSTVDPVKRAAHIKVCEKILQDNCVMVQPYWRQLFTAGDKKVKNFKMHPAQYLNLTKVWLG